MPCLIKYKNHPHVWNVKLTPKQSKPPIFNIPPFLVVPKNKRLMISPLKKKLNLYLKNGMRWNSLLINIFRATTNCIYKRVDKNIPLDCTRRETGTTDKT